MTLSIASTPLTLSTALTPLAHVDSIDYVDRIDSVDCDYRVDSVDTLDRDDSVDYVYRVDSVDTLDRVDSVDSAIVFKPQIIYFSFRFGQHTDFGMSTSDSGVMHPSQHFPATPTSKSC